MKQVIAAYAVVAGVVLLGLPNVASNAFTVYDPANFVQNKLTAVRTLQQYRQVVRAYQTQLRELQEAARQVEALTGSRGMGALRTGEVFRTARRYTPRSWRDTLAILERGGQPARASDVERIMRDMEREYAMGDPANYTPAEFREAQAHANRQRETTNVAVMASAQASFDRTERRFSDHENLMNRIDGTPDLKAIADLNATIGAENGLLLAELIRVNALQMQQTTTADQQRATDEKALKRITEFSNQPIKLSPAR